MSGETVERAKGRWRQILPRLGIETRYLTNKHGPCPLCGGRDRYRFDDRDGSGSYFCNQCGAGNGIIMLRKLHGWDFGTACREIDQIIGTATPKRQQSASTRTIGAETHRAHAVRRALGLANHDAVIRSYLTTRGLSVSSPVLRGDAQCPYYGKDEEADRSKLVGYFPAVLAPIIGPDGKLQSAMRIYDADVDPRKKIIEPVNTIVGAAVRLQEASDTLAITEGIETGLAVNELTGLPVWSVLSTSGMKSFEPPPNVRELHISGTMTPISRDRQRPLPSPTPS